MKRLILIALSVVLISLIPIQVGVPVSFAPGYEPNILKLSLLSPESETIENAAITWLAMKDGVGPDEPKGLGITFEEDNYILRLPGKGEYFFTIRARGYKAIQNLQINIKERTEEFTLHMKSVFGPVASGFWYPANRESLRNLATSYLSKATIGEIDGRIVAVIAPHAGIEHCGQVAAHSFAPLRKQKFKKVLILAPSHWGGYRGASILKANYYKTPLGLIELDLETCDKLLKADLIDTIQSAHLREHSLENLLPFLQLTLGEFKLIPIVVGSLSDEDYQVLSSTIKKHIDKDTLIVVSSDFTHFGARFGYTPFEINGNVRNNIEKLDYRVIDNIIRCDFEGFRQYLQRTGATICGRVPIGLLLKILPIGAKGKLVDYRTSGDANNDYRLSVSYASIVFTN